MGKSSMERINSINEYFVFLKKLVINGIKDIKKRLYPWDNGFKNFNP